MSLQPLWKTVGNTYELATMGREGTGEEAPRHSIHLG